MLISEFNIYQCLAVSKYDIQILDFILSWYPLSLHMCHQHLHLPLFKSIWQQKHTVLSHIAALSFLFKIISIYSFQNSYHICTPLFLLFLNSYSKKADVYTEEYKMCHVIMVDARQTQNTSVQPLGTRAVSLLISRKTPKTSAFTN